MFDSDFMEFFSRVHPSIPLILYLPVVGFMLYVAIWRQGFPVFVVVGFFLLGMLLWTLYGLMLEDLPLIAANTFSVGCYILLLVLKIVYDRKTD